MGLAPKIQDPRKTCLTCEWFQFVPDHKPRTRGCVYPGILEFSRGSCHQWKNMFTKADRIKAFLHLKTLHRKSMVT